MSAPEISGSIATALDYVSRWVCRFSQYKKGDREAVSDSFSDSNAGEWFVRVAGEPELVEQFVTQPTPIVCDAQSSTPEDRGVFEQNLTELKATLVQALSSAPAWAPDTPAADPANAVAQLAVELNFGYWKQPGDYQLQFTIDPPIAQGLNHQYSVHVGGDALATITCHCSQGSVGLTMLGQLQFSAVASPGLISTATVDANTPLTITGNDANGSVYSLAGDARVRIT